VRMRYGARGAKNNRSIIPRAVRVAAKVRSAHKKCVAEALVSAQARVQQRQRVAGGAVA